MPRRLVRLARGGVLVTAATLLGAACASEPAPEAVPEFQAPAASSSQEFRPVEVAATVAFTEGPTVDAEGRVYFTDLANSRIMTLSPDGVLSTFREESYGANGLIFDSEWRPPRMRGWRRRSRAAAGDPHEYRYRRGGGRCRFV